MGNAAAGPQPASGAPPPDVVDRTSSLAADVKSWLATDALGAYERIQRGRAEGVALDLWLRQREALALARVGAPGRALELLAKIRQEGNEDAETLGLLGRVEKDLALGAGPMRERLRHLERSLDLYAEAYRKTGDTWTGINAASMALLARRGPDAARLAGQVHERCLRIERGAVAAPGDDAYWRRATLGEAAVILGRKSEALDWYARAREVVDDRWADLASTRRNAQHLLATLGKEWEPYDRALHMPPLAICVGHMLDRPGRDPPRFPFASAGAVKAALASWIRTNGVRFGVASAACGTDLLFHEALGETGAESRVLLPYPDPEFTEDSVAVASDPSWVERYRAVLESHVGRLSVASLNPFQRDSGWYDYGNAFLEGLGRVWAEELGAPIRRIAVWDGKRGDGPGGTAGMAQWWAGRGTPFDVLDVTNPAPGPREWRGGVDVGAPPRPEAEVVTALFADASGYSRLNEDQLEAFNTHFFGAVRRVMDASAEAPVVSETWGDGLFFVFKNLQAAGLFALDLRDRMGETLWTEVGLPMTLGLRISIHTGPVKFRDDPVTGRKRALGAHVSHAARLEPVTPVGEVYASEGFAVQARVVGAKGFSCTYVGSMEWAKHYARLPTYVVERAHPA